MSPRRSRGWKVWIERGGDNWRCRWTGKYGTGQQVFALKDDAYDFARDKRRDFQRMDAGMVPAPKIISSVTVSEWWESYKRTKQHEHPETFRRFDAPALTPFVDKYKSMAMAALTEKDVIDYKYALEDKYKGDTPRMYYQQVCAFFNAAVRSGHLTVSPAKAVKKPADGGGGGRPLLDSEILLIFATAPESLYRTGVFSMNTRLRINEVCILDWRWTWEIEIPQGKKSPLRVLMGRIPAELRKGRSKIKEDCVFAINAAARVVMGPRKDSGRVFPWATVTIQHQMTRVRVAAKLPEDVTFHCFRHTGASRYLSTAGPDGGHMEDLLKTHVWDDPRSLLRYVVPDPQTLYRRAQGMKIDVPAPFWPLKAKGRRPKTLVSGPS